MIEREEGELSLSRQRRLLEISRSSLCYRPKGESAQTLALMRKIDELFLRYPFYGSRQMVRHLRRDGVGVGRHRVRRLMRLMESKRSTRRPRPVRRIPSTGRTPICSRTWRSSVRITCGARTSPSSRCAQASCTWSRSWTGRVVACCRGVCRTVSTPRSAWRRSCATQARDLQHGPGQPVHQLSLYRCPQGGRSGDLDGRSGPVHGQRLHRASVALAEVRGGLPSRTRRRPQGAAPDRRVASLLQHGTPHSSLDGRTPTEAHRGLAPSAAADEPRLPQNQQFSTAPTTAAAAWKPHETVQRTGTTSLPMCRGMARRESARWTASTVTSVRRSVPWPAIPTAVWALGSPKRPAAAS